MNEMNANAVETKEPENATASTPPTVSYTHLSTPV